MRRTMLAGALAIGVGLAAAPVELSAQSAYNTAALNRARSKVTKGQKLLKKESFASAEKAFRQAIELWPELPSAHLGLGAALVGQKQFADAEPVLEGAEAKFVAFEKWLQKMDLASRQWSGNRESLATGGGAAAYGTGAGGAGMDAVRAGRDRDLTPLIQSRLAETPGVTTGRWKVDEFAVIPAQVFYFEGLCKLRTGDRAGGVEALRRCLILDPGHGLAHYNLAVALFMGRDAAGAREQLDAAVAAGVKPNPRFVADVEKATGGR